MDSQGANDCVLALNYTDIVVIEITLWLVYQIDNRLIKRIIEGKYVENLKIRKVENQDVR
jgi:hypothetical protein